MTNDVGADLKLNSPDMAPRAIENSRATSDWSSSGEDSTGFEFRFEFERTMAALGSDPQLARRLLLSFYSRHQQTPQQLRDALADGDLATARSLAHSLKGTAGTIGFRAISDAAKQLEGALQPWDIEASLQLLDALDSACATAFAELAAAAAETESASDSATRPVAKNRHELLHALTGVRELLQRFDPDAAEHFERLSTSLSGQGFTSEARQLLAELQGFDYVAAEHSLNQLQQKLEKPGA
ncbi:Hpt domain-containing protein [Pseudomarimonas arenosa]|uniref:Hpt domain-containing protein n=1 Tax=Pseudomarimonas arenosa TaxID=2774145 RepID=A0AAW3ZFL9_9GAMM|nr:Hpt domain-containing protein [Pseudomarimonas arenosa]MBD8524285.1 Hpt domain-containing protein [Pseudomarimonas arenosa]